MIELDTVNSFNTRLTVDTSNIRRLTPGQRDTVKSYGSAAEALLKNKDLAMFVHHFKFELSDLLISITGHTEVDNATRIAVANHMSGLDNFVTSLRLAVHKKDKVLAFEQQPSDKQSF